LYIANHQHIPYTCPQKLLGTTSILSYAHPPTEAPSTVLFGTASLPLSKATYDLCRQLSIWNSIGGLVVKLAVAILKILGSSKMSASPGFDSRPMHPFALSIVVTLLISEDLVRRCLFLRVCCGIFLGEKGLGGMIGLGAERFPGACG
jgi:hypothetical protein